ncbi:hypothetical protein AB44_4924 [Escherichia coli 3-073-06_S1_C2]|uniref:Uncharacterized protein n=1 Tax=Escherichia coli 2-460-02_S1_C1 TaxID=1444044 RepID=A0A837AIV4_ECOLX|nr:hypothetical protein L282_2554 [Escherichia coli APEC IMT5155]EIH04225.1 hypothetical protein EC50588_4614 [Escherichia coli 5.0588]EIH13099.1 hypothetical protein EC990741_4758 [Escherichia coli 97.0259]ENA14673.1 hypothetical protein ECBCE008MS13_3141 [Escherichia coli BCE008_MS-13]ENB13619.1 hypothetical protein ECBCE008MS01_3124 [Escherichia coli BCE008_MS-01]ESD34465.1 hypothetical protein HMPREF1604_04923 [Escherichia coli 908519]EYD87034.1 hypothetical protein AB11_2152 [Escherichia
MFLYASAAICGGFFAYSKQFGFLKKSYPKPIDAYKKVKNGE